MELFEKLLALRFNLEGKHVKNGVLSKTLTP